MQAKSLGDMLRTTVRTMPDKVAVLAPTKSKFNEITYSQLFSYVGSYAGALCHLGIARGDKVALISENCFEWALVDWACCCLGAVSVPIYPTLPADQAQFIVVDSGAKLVVAGGEEQAVKTRPLGSVKTMLLKGEDSLEKLATGAGVALGSDALDREIDATGREDVFTIIYTSGTTGVPKGAMLPHRASIHVCDSVAARYPIDHRDTFLTFLPMSHVYERIAGQHFPIRLGATLAYSKNLASLSNDMMKVKPTILLCVPRFLESLRERVLDSVEKSSPLRRKLFAFALAQGILKARGKLAPFAGITDRLVMSKIRERTGGRIRLLVSGGAALARHVAEFYMAVGLTVLQGYGLTETAGGTCVNHPARNKYWTVGESLDMEIKIADDGEILIRGDAVMLGYHNLPLDTAEAIDSEGWFHSGDIGEFEGTNLKITDRKKDLVVLGNGKNIAPQPIENKLRESELIGEAVLFGDGMGAMCALVVPSFDMVRRRLDLAESVKMSDCAEARALIKKEIERVNKTLANFEIVKKFALLDEAFSIESGELTPSLKVKRKVVREKYRSIIEGLA